MTEREREKPMTDRTFPLAQQTVDITDGTVAEKAFSFKVQSSHADAREVTGEIDVAQAS